MRVGGSGGAIELEDSSVDRELERKRACFGITFVGADSDPVETGIEAKSVADTTLLSNVRELDGSETRTETVECLWTGESELCGIANSPKERRLTWLQSIKHNIHNLL